MDLGVIYIKDDSMSGGGSEEGEQKARRNLGVTVPIRQPRGNSFLLRHSFSFLIFPLTFMAEGRV